jgi:hypothetical protein
MENSKRLALKHRELTIPPLPAVKNSTTFESLVVRSILIREVTEVCTEDKEEPNN